MSESKPRVRVSVRPAPASARGEGAARKAGAPRTASTMDWKSFGRFFVLLLWAGTLAGVAFGLHVLKPAAASTVTAPTRIEWVNRPAWLESDEWRPILTELERLEGLYPDSDHPGSSAPPRLTRRAGITPETDIFHDDVCRFVGEQLGQSAWIERLDRVTKVSDGRIRVTAAFRRPFSLVEKNGVAYLIDEKGVRLPWQLPAANVDHERGLTITGVRGALPAIGQAWEGQDLQDGIKLVRLLARTIDPKNPPAIRAYLRSVSVSNFDGRQNRWAGRLRLVTKMPSVYIDWGVPPGEEYPIEASAERKAGYLGLGEVLKLIADGHSVDFRDPDGYKPVPRGE